MGQPGKQWEGWRISWWSPKQYQSEVEETEFSYQCAMTRDVQVQESKHQR